MINRKDKAAHIAAYWDVITRANAGIVEEVIEMGNASLTLEQVLENAGWIAKWEARGKAKWENQKALKIAQNMINRGLSFEDIVSLTQLDPEQVKQLYQ